MAVATMTIPEALAPSLLAEGFTRQDNDEFGELTYVKQGHGIDVEFFGSGFDCWMAIHMAQLSNMADPQEWITVLEARVRNPVHGRALLWAMGLIGANKPGDLVAMGA